MHPPQVPAFVHLELTRHCNLNCFYCSIRDNTSTAPSEYSLQHFTGIIDKLVDSEVFQVSFFGGEPFLNPHILELGAYSRDRGLVTNFLSNGTLIRPSDLGKIASIFRSGTIALNGLEESHDRMVGRPGAFRNTTKIISDLSGMNFPTGIDTVVCASNVAELQSFLSWIAEKLPKIAAVFLNLYVPYKGTFREEQLSQSQLAQVCQIIDECNRTNELRNKIGFGGPLPYCQLPTGYEHLRKNCSAGWTFGNVDWLGNVRTCAWSGQILGNIFDDSLENIWQKSKGIEYFRSLNWVNNDACKSCGFLSSCLGGCKVTSTELSYSVASNWKEHMKPFRNQDDVIESKAKTTLAQEAEVAYVVRPGLRTRKEKNGGLLYLAHQNKCFWANNTTLVVLELLKQGLRKEQIVDALVIKYHTSAENLTSGLERILLVLEQLGVVESADNSSLKQDSRLLAR